MLHVMLGERPIPSFRFVPWKINEKIFKIAQNGFIKYFITENKDKKGENKIHYETIHGNKIPYNSWQKTTSVDWYKIKRLCGDNWNIVVDEINKYIPNASETPIMELRGYFKNVNEFEDLYLFLKNLKLSPIANLLNAEKENFNYSEITKNKKILDIVNKYPLQKINVNGELILKIDDEILNRIVKSNTTILDGGLAKIIDVIDENELEMEDFFGFEKISKLSLEKI